MGIDAARLDAFLSDPKVPKADKDQVVASLRAQPTDPVIPEVDVPQNLPLSDMERDQAVSNSRTPLDYAALGGRAVGEGVLNAVATPGDLLVGAYNSLPALIGQPPMQVPRPSEGIGMMLDAAGAPNPETPGEKLTSAGVRGAAGAATGVGVGRLLGLGAAPGSAAGRAGTVLAAEPKTQVVAGVTGGAAAEEAQQRGASPLAAGLVGAMLPFAGRGAWNVGANAAERANAANTAAGQQNIVGSILKKAVAAGGGDVNKVGDQIAQTRALVRDDPVFSGNQSTNPRLPGLTTGAASNEPGLIALENSLANTTPMESRAIANQKSALDNFQSANRVAVDAPTGTDTRQFLQQQADQRAAQREASAAQAQGAHADANDAVDQRQQSVAPVAAGKTAAAQRIDQTVSGELERGTQTNRRNYDLGESAALPVDAEPLQDIARTITDEIGPLVDPKDIPQKILNRILGSAEPGESGAIVGADGAPLQSAGSAQVTIGDVQTLKNWLSEEAGRAHRASRGALGRRLAELGQGMDAQLRQVAEQYPDVAARMRQADTTFRDEFAPKFREGAGGQYADATRAGTVRPTETPTRFLTEGPGSLERSQDLQRIIAGAPNAAAAQRDVVDYLMSDFAETIGRGTVTREKLTRWIDARRDMLGQFPAARDEIHAMRNRFGRDIETRTQAENALERITRQNKAATTAEKELSETRFFLGREPVDAVAAVLKSDLPAQNMRRLVSEAKRDPSGRALEGLRTAVKDWATDSTRTGGMVNESVKAGGDEALSARIKMLDNSKVRTALEQVYTPAEMRSMDLARKQLQILNRSSYFSGVNSKTAKNMADVAGREDTIMRELVGMSKVGRVTGIIGDMFKTGDAKAKIDKLLQDAMLDPELARTLLMRPESKIGQRALKSRIPNTVLTQNQQDSKKERP